MPDKYGEHHISGGCVEYVACSIPAHCMPVHCIRVCNTFRWNFSHAIKTFVAAKMRAHVRQGAWHSIVFRVRRLHIRQCHRLCCMCRHYHVIKSMHPRFTGSRLTIKLEYSYRFTWRVIVNVSVTCLLFCRKIWKCNRVASDGKIINGIWQPYNPAAAEKGDGRFRGITATRKVVLRTLLFNQSLH